MCAMKIALALWAAIAVVALGAGYEALVALGVIGLGSSPGAAPPGDSVAVLSAVAALLAASALLAVAAGRPAAAWPERSLAVVVAAPVAVAFVVARWYSYDPYYAPYLQRMSDGGVVAGRWIAVLVLSAIAAALVARRNLRAGAGLAAPLLLVFAATAFVAALGH
jgi:hypothetical protein